jgi:hypothetical protein
VTTRIAPHSAPQPTGLVGQDGEQMSQRDAGTSHLLRDEDGTLAVVYRLDTELVSDPGFQSAYPGEAAALSGLQERRIASPERYVVDPMGRIVSVIRQFFDSAPLSALLALRPRGLDAQTAASVVNDVLTALCALHQRGVPHRSVGAGQVLVGADGVCVLVDIGLVPRTAPPDAASPTRDPAENAAAIARERQAAMAEDLAAAADLFAACVAPGRLRASLLPARRVAPPDGVPDSVPDRLNAVLATAKGPQPPGLCTAAELLAAFAKATKAFDAGWDERGRERLAALVQDNLQAPAGLTQTLRVRWGQRQPHNRRSQASSGVAGPPSRHRLTASADAIRRVRLRARTTGLRPTQRSEQHGPRHNSAGDRTWIHAAVLYTALLTMGIAGLSAIVMSGDHTTAAQKPSHPTHYTPASPTLKHSPGSTVGTATATAPAVATAAATPTLATPTATTAPAVPSPTLVTWVPQSFLLSDGSIDSHSTDSWAQSDLILSDGSIDSHSTDSWAQSDLIVSNHLTVTALDARLHVALTPGVANTGAWSTIPADDLVTTITSDGNSLLYEFVLKPGVTLAPSSYEFAAQYNHAQGHRDASNDNYQVTATARDNPVEVAGSFH